VPLVVGFTMLLGGVLLLTSGITTATFKQVISGQAGQALKADEESAAASTATDAGAGQALGSGVVGTSAGVNLGAAAGGTLSLKGIPGKAGPVANTFVPATSWNPLSKPIANWIVPVLNWASQHGWTGSVTSGFRTEAEQAAINASGAFSAPAGDSNHETTIFPGGAVDVTNPSQLISVLKGYIGGDKLTGGVLGAVDPEHFSATGH
jgi:hypothetical protein